MLLARIKQVNGAMVEMVAAVVGELSRGEIFLKKITGNMKSGIPT